MEKANEHDENNLKSQIHDSEIKQKKGENKYCLYAPTDGIIHSIEKLNDGVFSAKTLGDGVYLIPSSPAFFCPLDNATVSLVAKAKHAIAFQVGNATLLLHVGIDSVNLNGEPFTVFVKQGDLVNHTSQIIRANLDLLRAKNISLATPLVLDQANENHYQFVFDKRLENQHVQHGQVIGWIQPIKTNAQIKSHLITNAVDYVNPFEAAAKTICDAVGRNNFSDYANCMTRFRMQVNDKSTVNEELIKKIPIVKGLHWNGAQLQIIIGGDVVKVTDCFRKYLEKPPTVSDEKPKTFGRVLFRKQFLAVVTSVIFPILPILIASGVLKSIYALFISAELGHAPDNIYGTLSDLSKTYLNGGGGGVDIRITTHVNAASYVLFVVGDLPFLFLALFFLISVVKRLKGDVVIGTAIGLILSAPLIYTIGFPYDYSHVLSWNIFQYPGFKINNVIDKSSPLIVAPIGVGVVNLSQNIFVMVGTGLFYVWFDRWVKQWMPAVIDLFARHALCVIVTVIMSFSLLNVVMSAIQYVLQVIVVFLTAIPYGLGLLMFSLLWQPLVITGAHAPIAFVILAPLFNQPPLPSKLMFGMQLAALAQAGAGFANGCLTKNSAARATAFSTAPVAVLGITEPVMYGVNLFKFKSFILACVAAGIAGWFCGITNVLVVNAGALGILALPSLIPAVDVPSEAGINIAENVGFGALGLIIAFGAGFALVFIFCREYVSTNKQFSQIARLLKRSLMKYNEKATQKLSQATIDNYVMQANQLTYSTKSKQALSLVHDYKQYISKLSKLDRKLDKLNKKEDQIKRKLSKKAKYYQKKQNQNKLAQVNQKFVSVDFSQFRKILLDQRAKLVDDNQHLQNRYNQFKTVCLKQTEQFVEKLKVLPLEPLAKLTNNYFNAINVIDIAFDLIAPKQSSYNKRELKKWLTKSETLNVNLQK